MASTGTWIQLCGRFVARVDGRRVDERLPGRQGRLLFAYLVLHRNRPLPRAELVDALWPGEQDGADAALSALLSKLRRVLAPLAVEGRSDVQLVLPSDARVDLETASEAVHRAESALALGQWGPAWAGAYVALHIAQRGFLSGEEAEWVDAERRSVEQLHVRALEATATACLQLGGTELPMAERCARKLVRLAPHRESGYRLLMLCLAESGNDAEALGVYEDLRTRLRDDLGAHPGPATRALHAKLLRGAELAAD